MEKNNDIQIRQIAEDIINLSRNTLILNLRFLDRAIGSLKTAEGEVFSTDGQNIYFNSLEVLLGYKENRCKVTRNFLHAILHCVLRHLFISGKVDKNLWNVACDIAVEAAINGMDLNCVKLPKEKEQEKIISKLKDEIKFITAEKIYHYYKTKGLSQNEIQYINSIFKADEHDNWYSDDTDDDESVKDQQESDDLDIESYKEKESDGSENEDSDLGSEKDKEQGEEIQRNAEIEEEKQKSDGGSSEEYSLKNSSESSSDLSQMWEDISQQVQTDLETMSKKWGDKAGELTQSLRECNREKYDYTEFLRQFSSLGEEITVNDDEFDYVFYTYGLEMYGNMPLIESLEYKEMKKIKDFVIAIDTSGSVKGDIVQKFITKTYNILKQSESFFTKVNIHIIQCDCQIQEDKKITNAKEFDEYMAKMTLKGFGGTDFTPVFEHVEKLINEKDITNIKGLIYFTDGYGKFPVNEPKYSTAFVFVDDNYSDFNVPSWAIRLVLGTEDI